MSSRNALLKYIYYAKVVLNLIFLLALCIPIGLNIHEFYDAANNITDIGDIRSHQVNQVSSILYND